MRDDTKRQLDFERAEMLKKWAITVQSVYRGCYWSNEYKRIQGSYTAMRVPLRAFIAKTLMLPERESAKMADDKTWMVKYLQDQIGEREEESLARATLTEEDEYCFRIMDATAQDRFNTDK